MVGRDAALIKERIINFLSSNGPSLPIFIAREIREEMLFCSAFLSELLSEKRIKSSNMKVGSSSVFYLPGQEKGLEEFAKYLKNKEKEAFSRIKDNKILKDSEQEPAIRVALRSIKDFAIPLEKNNEIYWKYFIEENTPLLEEKIKEEIVQEETKETPVEKINEITLKPSIKIKSGDFIERVRDAISKIHVKIIEELEIKKKEYVAIGRMEDKFGEIEVVIWSKDKKKLGLKDLEVLKELFLESKKQVIAISFGEIEKKCKENFREYRNLIRVMNDFSQS